MNTALKTSLGTLAVSLVAGLAAQAQVVIFDETFEGSLSAGANFSHYGPGGDGTAFQDSIVAGVGVGGTGGWLIQTTAAAGGSAGYSYFGAQYQNGGVTGNTSANLADYTLSFDAWSTGGSLNVQVQTWTGAGFGGSMTGTLNTAPASPGYGNDLPLYGQYTHYSLNLADASIWHGGTIIPSGGTYQVAMQFNNGGPTPYTQTLYVDNFELTMVPEPSLFALAGLGIMGLINLRRRQA